MDIRIVFEDKDIIVVEKPAGVASQEDRSRDMDLVNWLRNYLSKGNGIPYVGVIHRLDKPVSGLLVYAKNQRAAAALSAQVQKGTVTKKYLTVLTGLLPGKKGELKDYLVKDAKTNLSRVCTAKTPGAKKAVLQYKVLRTKFDEGCQYTLAEITLLTGRHHQIRVQTAHAGAGIYGDTKYNAQAENSDEKTGNWYKLALCAYILEFDHPTTKKRMKYQMEPPASITEHFEHA